MMDGSALRAAAKRMRLMALGMARAAGLNGAHVGGGFSEIDILAALYLATMRVPRYGAPDWEERDRLILSKGHGTLGYYAALRECGYLTDEDIAQFEVNGGDFPGQPMMNQKKGIESSSGSLGMGLSLAVGMAYAAKLKGQKHRVFALLGDGECNEGTVWEAAMLAAHLRLENIVAVIDKNNLQIDGFCKDVLDMAPFAGKWAAFGWEAVEVDGHDMDALCGALRRRPGKPYAVVAETIKGKGLPFAENNRAWHHGIIRGKQYDEAYAAIMGNEAYADD